MNAPQITMIVILVLEIVAAAYLHGTYRKPWNFASTLIAVLILTALLWWGGFWA